MRAGKYTVAYEIDAGLGGETKAKTAGGVTPGGTFVTDITTALPETEVNGAGEIVEIEPGAKQPGGNYPPRRTGSPSGAATPGIHLDPSQLVPRTGAGLSTAPPPSVRGTT